MIKVKNRWLLVNGSSCNSYSLRSRHDTKLMKDIKSLLKEAIRDNKESFTSTQRVTIKVQYDKTL
ncbi:hypothetical protein [Sulfurimonas sp.]|jgi:hypothetical protein|uniref:hypothetical protein n=1 Tax=Sulfurimonas sp. TaxID=2022749 RepID=UPI0025CEC409|nr:hypothetical protein [Sulfurimonas sp.]MBT5934154.1 hypothetical protein [Sulfurimonas sp.]